MSQDCKFKVGETWVMDSYNGHTDSQPVRILCVDYPEPSKPILALGKKGKLWFFNKEGCNYPVNFLGHKQEPIHCEWRNIYPPLSTRQISGSEEAARNQAEPDCIGVVKLVYQGTKLIESECIVKAV